jgi:hypothetical protein
MLKIQILENWICFRIVLESTMNRLLVDDWEARRRFFQSRSCWEKAKIPTIK